MQSEEDIAELDNLRETKTITRMHAALFAARGVFRTQNSAF